jgi:hypothetical protein
MMLVRRRHLTPTRFSSSSPRRGYLALFPIFEVVEDRLLMTTFLVTNVNDSGLGSLRQAIIFSNASTNPGSVIDFSITGANRTIIPQTPLPTITEPVLIDGTSQTGYSGISIVEIQGSSFTTNGLSVTAGDTTIQGLILDKFSGYAISLTTNGGDAIEGNYIGTNPTGITASANGTGVYLDSASNVIGGTTSGAGNVISANGIGIDLDTAASGNLIQGNLVGTDSTGTKKLGNNYGIEINGIDNTIGGTTQSASNVISGNGADGIVVSHTGTLLQGNLIGTNQAGTVALPNQVGIAISGDDTTVGGSIAGAGNLISGNSLAGIYFEGGTETAIVGNAIGTNIDNTGAIANDYGIYVNNAQGMTIGGTTPSSGNLIQDNDNGLVFWDKDISQFANEGGGTGVDVVGNDIETPR